MPRIDEIAVAIAAHRHGIVTRAELLDAGVSRSALDRRMAAGWERVAPGVVRLPGFDPTWRQSIAAVVAAGDRRAASHATAAHLHDLYRSPRPERVEVTVARGARVLGDARQHDTIWLPDEEVELVDAIPTTTVARTIADLAYRSSVDRIRDLIHDAIRRELTTPEAVLDVGHARPRLNGIVKLREAVETLHPEAAGLESPLEVAGLAFLRRHGFAAPTLQHEVDDPRSGRRARIDAAYPAQQVGIEFDGTAWHSVPSDQQRDRSRSDWLGGLGWRLVRVGWSDLRTGRQSATAARIRAALRQS